MKKVIFFLFFIGLLFDYTYAKCPTVPWHFRGKIKSFEEKVIEGAKVFIFFDDYENSCLAKYCAKEPGPDFLLTNSEGIYEGHCFFDTFKSYLISAQEHLCTRRPNKVEIVIMKEGFLPKKKVIYLSEQNRIKDAFDLGGRIILPDIILNGLPCK